MILPLHILLLVTVTLAVFFDIRERRIPNWITLPGTAIALVLHLWTGSTQGWQSFIGFWAGAGAMAIPFVCGWVGAGDVKLFGLMAAIAGLPLAPRIFFYSAITGGLLGVGVLVVRAIQAGFLKRYWSDMKLTVWSLGFIMPAPITESTVATASLPYGVAIGVGTLIALYLDPTGKWAGF